MISSNYSQCPNCTRIEFIYNGNPHEDCNEETIYIPEGCNLCECSYDEWIDFVCEYTNEECQFREKTTELPQCPIIQYSSEECEICNGN